MNVLEGLYLLRCGCEDMEEIIYSQLFREIRKLSYKIEPLSYSTLTHEDLMQEASLCFHQYLHQYREDREASFKTYVLLCASRRMRTIIRNENNYYFTFRPLSLEEEMENKRCSLYAVLAEKHTEYLPDQKYVADERYKKSTRFIKESCSQRDYKIFELFQFGYTPSEISERIDISLKSVYNSIYRVRKAMKSSFQFDYKDVI